MIKRFEKIEENYSFKSDCIKYSLNKSIDKINSEKYIPCDDIDYYHEENLVSMQNIALNNYYWRIFAASNILKDWLTKLP